MMYYIGQGMGILATIGCFVNPLFKKKWQMLVATMLVNILLALNLVFIGQVTSAVFLMLLVNVTLFFIYYLVLGSTSMFAELLAMFTTIIAIFKYRNVKKA